VIKPVEIYRAKVKGKNLPGLFHAVIIYGMAVCLSGSAQTVSSKMVFGQAYISSDYTINARPDSIILRLGNSDTMSKIMGYAFCSGARRLFRIGDAAVMVHQWGTYGVQDTVVIITSYLAPTEMCFTFEPRNGKYIYQDRWRILPSAGNKTKIDFMERYIDSEGLQSSGKTSERTRVIQEGLVKLKAIVERK
jgi:hypothetical protein